MWQYEILFNKNVICVSSRSYETSRQAEIEAALVISRMASLSGSCYTFRVIIGDFDL